MSFYTQKELQNLGFKFVGQNVLVSRKSSLYGIKNISIGDNSRIDDFCVISASDNGIYIGENVHIAVFCSLIGKEKIELSDYSGLSSRVSIYSSSDDYSGNYMTNPTVPDEFTNVVSKPVILNKHVIIGSGSVILPGVILGEGVAVGALSLVTKKFKDNVIISGAPARVIKERKKGYLEFENKFNNEKMNLFR
ncbi:TPA: acyltransferase [Photobacterium damselae]